MVWQFQALRCIYPFSFCVSGVVIGLLSRWLERIRSYINDFEDKANYQNSGQSVDIEVIYPGDFYFSFVIAGISFILTAGFLLPRISRHYGFHSAIMLVDVMLSVAWLIDAIIIVVGLNNGSLMHRSFVTSKTDEVPLTHEFTLTDDKLNEADRIGTAIMALAWLQSLVLVITTVIKFSAKRTVRRKEINDSEHHSLGSHDGGYDKDAKELTMDLDGDAVEQLKSEKTSSKKKKNASTTDTPTAPADGVIAEAQYNFRGPEDSDFSFQIGDRIRITRKTDNTADWWEGEVNGKVGEFPGNYVKLL